MGVFRLYPTLDEIFDKSEGRCVRVFCNCQTIFEGKRSSTSEREWNLTVRPYLHCRVFKSFTNNGIIVVLI